MKRTGYRPYAIAAVLIAALTGCETLPDDAFRLSETALETRQIQTREYESVSDVEILAASSAVLQDLGYAIDEVEKELGVLSASKRADASNAAEIAARLALDAASCMLTFLIACDNENFKRASAFQDIRLTLVVLPKSAESHSVRVTMQRVVWDRDDRITEQETISDADVYQAFFDKLSKSVFLEKEGV